MPLKLQPVHPIPEQPPKEADAETWGFGIPVPLLLLDYEDWSEAETWCKDASKLLREKIEEDIESSTGSTKPKGLYVQNKNVDAHQ
ncbi:MAG: hypothetical protein U0359_11095 [Byssovorax sp.]